MQKKPSPCLDARQRCPDKDIVRHHVKHRRNVTEAEAASRGVVDPSSRFRTA
jgi:hypothetical protein